MSDNLDGEEFSKRIYQEYDTYQMNLQQADTKKQTALLHTNYFQDCLKDSMEIILQSKEARRIPVKMIIAILKDRMILSQTKANDAMKICDIRDWFAHRVNVRSVEEDAKELIYTINVQSPIEENTIHVKEITDIIIRANKEKENFDLYERLDLICSDLSRTIRNEAIRQGNKSKTTGAI
ncbi:MAG: hypothetical protein GKS07_07095 [Nitrosopumilus sp.]|nr:MAG: hypothetical protein GKS07_07095 [Nitrosopumilus sp.]